MRKKALFEYIIHNFNLKEKIIFDQVKAVLISNGLDISNAHNIATMIKGIPYIGDSFVQDVLHYYLRMEGLEETFIAQLYSPSKQYTQSQANSPYSFWFNKGASYKDGYSILVFEGKVYIIPGVGKQEELIEQVLYPRVHDLEKFSSFVLGPYMGVNPDKHTLSDYAFFGVAKYQDGKLFVQIPPEIYRYEDQITSKLRKYFRGDIGLRTNELYSPLRPSLEEWVREFNSKGKDKDKGVENGKEKKSSLNVYVRVASPKGFLRPRFIPVQMKRIWDDALDKMRVEKPLFDHAGNPDYTTAINYYYNELHDRVKKLEDKAKMDDIDLDLYKDLKVNLWT